MVWRNYITFHRKELSFHPCVCQTRPQPIPPRVCWEVGKDQCHGSDLSIALNALHFAIPPSKRAASGSAADGWHKKEIHCDQSKFSAKQENDFWSPFSPLQLWEHENMCSSRLERYCMALPCIPAGHDWQVQCTLIFHDVSGMCWSSSSGPSASSTAARHLRWCNDQKKYKSWPRPVSNSGDLKWSFLTKARPHQHIQHHHEVTLERLRLNIWLPTMNLELLISPQQVSDVFCFVEGSVDDGTLITKTGWW